MIADRRRIGELLPHGPGMVLLDGVVACDEASVLCSTDSHLDPANPLRRHGRLPALAAIEYAAQAAALHAALNGRKTPGSGGVLGGVRDTTVRARVLDEIEGTLQVRARLLLAQESGAIYAFEVGSQDDAAAVEGRFTVMYA